MKPYTLTNREGETISPMTSTRTVFDERGVNLDTLLEQQRQDADNALKDYAKKTEVTQSLAGKQNKLTPTTDLHITEDNIIGLTEAAKEAWLIDIFNADPNGRYNEATGYFELNGLKDITLQQAKDIASYGNKLTGNADYNGWSATNHIRTNLTPINAANGSYCRSYDNLFQNQTKLEIANLSGYKNNGEQTGLIPGVFTVGTMYGMFDGCSSLRYVIGGVYAVYIGNSGKQNSIFKSCVNLETCYITRLRGDLNIQDCGKLNLDSFKYLITSSDTHSAITITVHPDVYAKLTGDTTNPAAAELTGEELAQWQQLLVDAAEKQINFATT